MAHQKEFSFERSVAVLDVRPSKGGTVTICSPGLPTPVTLNRKKVQFQLRNIGRHTGRPLFDPSTKVVAFENAFKKRYYLERWGLKAA